MKSITILFLLICSNLITESSYAKWEILVSGKNKVWKNKSFKKTYLTQSSSPLFQGNPKLKSELLEIFNIHDWKILKNEKQYILGIYIGAKGKLNYFLESKSKRSIHISTSAKNINLVDAYTSFVNGQ
jgi:hypothetical protein